MRKIISVYFVLLLTFFGFSQIKDPVKWSSKTEKLSDTEFNLIVTGIIEPQWHVYSQFTPDGGSLPMVLNFKEQNGNYQLVGKAKESPYKKHFNDIFEVEEYYFDGKVVVTQKVKITNPNVSKINLSLEYQACKEQCINDTKKFTFDIPKVQTKETVKPVEDTISKDVTTVVVDSIKPETVEPATQNGTPKAAIQPESEKDNKGLWTIFGLAFLGGLAALLTPCVFPMIPLTVSFFTKQSGTREKGIANAVIYAFSIIFIYVVLGLIINGLFGAKALNALSTGVIFNIVFFVILVFFAISFLGAFEITLPQSWANKVDAQSNKSGLIGIFFMALALAIVSFSCTGPIVGTLLVESASKGGIAPVIGMLGFSTAIALPFMLFALFPGWLNSLPKSGGWLNTVKVSLGFLELALAFKFLSNADLVVQAHWLERETFLAIWIAIFGAWALYLFGKITLPHDSPLSHISVGRLLLGLFVLAFTIYMIPGLFGAPVKWISAFPPPPTYSESPNGILHNAASTNEKALPNGAEIGVHGLTIFTDYEEGMAYAKEVNKPALLDFTGHACVNCRKMENSVWADPRVLSILKNDVVLISLYADDKRELPKEKQFVSKSTGETIETIGDKWTDFMITKYKTNTQPLYVLVDLEGNNLNTKTPTTSYNPDVTLYENWLKEGIANFKK